MKIKLTPQRSDAALSFSATGDLLVVNGIGFDLSAIQAGEVLPASALTGAPASGSVERVDGEIFVSLIEPHGRGESPEPRVVDAPTAAGVDWDAGVVDWVQIISPQSIADHQGAAIQKIDADVDSITAQVIGNRGVEYIEAETQALAYQAAGYTGAVPSMVQAWVNAKAIEDVVWTAQQAAEDILATAVSWRGAVDLIRANRLNAKAYVRIAADDSELAVAMGTWAGFVAAIRSQLGI